MVDFFTATSKDVELIRSLAAQTWAHTYGHILSKEQLDWMFEWMYSIDSLTQQIEQGQRFFIAQVEGVACAYISIERQKENQFHFQKIYAVPSVQGKGVGRALIEKGIEYVRSFGVFPCRIELNVNRQNKALQFYQHMGFSIASQGDFDIGHGYFMNDYIMAMDIKR